MTKVERTLSMIKPDAINKKFKGDIISHIENNGFKIVGQKKVFITKKQAEKFYKEHKDKSFFEELTIFMSSGPILVQVLEKENAILEYRNLMGSTNPESANHNTLRKKFGENIQNNAVHGSDSPESAMKEISFFFSEIELLDY